MDAATQKQTFAPTDLSPADRLAMLLREDMQAVDLIIHDRLTSRAATIPDISNYLIDAGGKRLRPMLTLAAARALGGGGGGESARKLAAAVEFIHSATLLHDDVVDESGLRRGRVSANLVWGNAASILVGDFLFARAFTLMVDTGDIRLLDILSRASSVIAEGEVLQLEALSEPFLSRERYFQIIAAKTAALFSAAAETGALSAGADAGLAEAFSTFGRELGLAFQLADDALDYGGLTAKLGKNVGDDFREGKTTMPVVVALERANAAERDFWARTLQGRPQQEAGDFDQALAILRRVGGVETTLEIARERALRARDALSAAPPSPYREALADIAIFTVERAS